MAPASAVSLVFELVVTDALGLTSVSNSVTITVRALAPSTTTALSVTLDTAGTTATADGGSAITGYQIQRAEGASGTFSNIAPVHTGTTTTYNDTGLTAGTIYRYQVAAINSVGTGAYSAEASSAPSVTLDVNEDGTMSHPATP